MDMQNIVSESRSGKGRISRAIAALVESVSSSLNEALMRGSIAEQARV
jgi:hypothetical protein